MRSCRSTGMTGCRFLVLSVALVIAGCSAEPTGDGHVRPVRVAVVESTDARDSKSFGGIVRERDLVRLSFRVAGQMEEIPVEEGQFVQKGEVLASLDPRDYRLQLEAIRAEHEQVTADVRRIRELHARNNITASEYGKALAGEGQINAKLKAAENALADTRLVAPFDGYVQNLYVSEKEMVDAGTVVLSVVDVNTLVIEVNIPPAFYLLKDRFDEFTFSTSHYPEQTFSLELIGIAAKADTGNLYRTRFRYRPGNDYPLAPGMSVRVTIHYLRDSSQPVKIPVTALVSREGTRSVWIFRDGRLEKRAVTTGMVDSDGTVAVHSGLSPGDVIVTAGAQRLVDGQKVSIEQ